MSEAIAQAEAVIRSLAPGGKDFDFNPPLREDESRWFLAAIEQRLMPFGECDPGCFRLKKWKETGPDHFSTPAGKPRHLFSAPHQPRAWLNPEYVPHIAAYARAVLDAGYDAALSSFSRYA